MKRLNKIQNIVFITGAVLLLIGAATFFTGWLYAFYLYTVGLALLLRCSCVPGTKGIISLSAGCGDNKSSVRFCWFVQPFLWLCVFLISVLPADRNGWYAWQSLACWNCTPLFVFRPNWRKKSHEKTTISFKTEKTSLNSDKTLYPLVISAYLCTPISPE